MKKIFLIDNYDSFTYNIVHYLEELNCQVTIKRNDQFTLKEPQNYDGIVLSPGPGLPAQAGLLKKTIVQYAPTHKIFGVCLGQQAIAEVFGGHLWNLSTVYHGVASKITVTQEDPLFRGLPRSFQVGRYHSWIVQNPLPKVLLATSVDENGEIMSLRHKEYSVSAVQYHPESILTPFGKQILANWIACIA